MVSIGNKAKLVNSEICQKCGRCCKEFTMGTFDLDIALRFAWIDDKKVKAKDLPFRDTWGGIQRQITFKFPCSKLKCESGKCYCTVYDKERPDFCNTYPDNIFYECDNWNTQKIERMLTEASIDCPALKNVTVEQVQKMLIERENNKGDK